MRGAYFERAILFFWNILLQFTVEGIIRVGLFIKDVFMVMEKGAASKYSYRGETLYFQKLKFFIIDVIKSNNQSFPPI